MTDSEWKKSFDASGHRHRWSYPKVVELRDSGELVSRCRCGAIRRKSSKGRTFLIPPGLQELLRRAWIVEPDSEEGGLVREALRMEALRD